MAELDARTAQALIQQLAAILPKPAAPGSVDNRGRGGEHDAWVVDWHYTCPNVQVVESRGRLYHWCPEHRCFGLVCYETCRRITFEESADMERVPVKADVLAERAKRTKLVADGGAK